MRVCNKLCSFLQFVVFFCLFLPAYVPAYSLTLGGHALCRDSGPSLELGVNEGLGTLFFVFLLFFSY